MDALASREPPYHPTNDRHLDQKLWSPRRPRLGETLLSAGVISPEQLRQALAQQPALGLRLGENLIQIGAITRRTRHQALATQRTLALAAAMISAIITLPERALGHDTNPPTLTFSQPQLAFPVFDADAIRLFATSQRVEWPCMLAAFDSRQSRGCKAAWFARCVESEWEQMIALTAPLSPSQQLEQVNAWINRLRYLSDPANYGQADLWADPLTFLERGDCKDYAIAKYFPCFVSAGGIRICALRLWISGRRAERMPYSSPALTARFTFSTTATRT